MMKKIMMVSIYSYSTKQLWNMVSHITGRMQVKLIWEQDPEANILAQEGWEWEVEKVSERGKSYYVLLT